ncbi:hypothetical protein AOH201_11660 [Helicobacter pylori]
MPINKSVGIITISQKFTIRLNKYGKKKAVFERFYSNRKKLCYPTRYKQKGLSCPILLKSVF